MDEINLLQENIIKLKSGISLLDKEIESFTIVKDNLQLSIKNYSKIINHMNSIEELLGKIVDDVIVLGVTKNLELLKESLLQLDKTKDEVKSIALEINKNVDEKVQSIIKINADNLELIKNEMRENYDNLLLKYSEFEEKLEEDQKEFTNQLNGLIIEEQRKNLLYLKIALGISGVISIIALMLALTK